MLKTLLLTALLASACAVSQDVDPPQAMTIPANHCGTLTAIDPGPILIGTDPDDLGPGPDRIEYSVTFDFHFFTRNARLAISESCE